MSATAFSAIDQVIDEAAVGAAERERRGEHPYALVRALARAGFGRLRVPTEYGGLGVDLPTLFELLRRAGRADSNLPQIWRGHFTTVEILLRETDPAVRHRWLTAVGAGAVFGNAQTEPAASAAAGPPTRVFADGTGERVVSGTKFYSTGARFADFLRVAAVDDDGHRRFVVVDARDGGVRHVDDWDGVGQRQTGSGTTVFTSVPVQPDGDIGRDETSLAGLDSFVQIVHLANLAGIADNLVDETVTLVRGRSRTGRHALSQIAAEDPDVLAVIGRLHARRIAARSLLGYAADRLQQAHRDDREESFATAYVETSAAQTAIVEAVLDAAAHAFDAGGSSAVRAPVGLDRHWRNARTLASHNPIVYKPRVVGDFFVNDVLPVSGYYTSAERTLS
ncbi:acyl-CoA dehydrogenase family protein [Gordonia sp. VNK21]|uniref:acyl-CoA dehydrogenase family protein n=1 Tax=Gordonia sp. VNK21 TaxID=3382483 RepID=UPI0038D4549B